MERRILMLPWLAHGHISPFFELAKKLSSRNFHIYICSTAANLNSIKNKLTSTNYSSIQLVELHLPLLPYLPPHYHTTNGLPPHLMPTLKTAMDSATPSFSAILVTLKPDLVVYDFNQPWAPATAAALNIPAVQFLVFGGLFISYATHLANNPEAEFPFPELHLGDREKVRVLELLEFSTGGVTDGLRYLDSLKRSSNILLIKSVVEIEGKYLDFLSGITGKRVVPVGPLIGESIAGEEDDSGEFTRWLDGKDEGSTVFVSFGSEFFLTKKEMEEMAHGLEGSTVNFIWVVRFPKGEGIRVSEVLPLGFLERVKGRGVVVEGWAPQAKILCHKSVGGFVSHCGWSSVIESMRFGVPIIAMPMQIDQPLNARLFGEIGLGLEVLEREGNGLLEREGIAKTIKRVVLEKEGEGMRRKAKEMGEIIGRKGDEEIDCVVEEFVQLCGPTKL